MPRALPLDVRLSLARAFRAGQTPAATARDHGLPDGTVRSLFARFRRCPDAPPLPGYHACGQGQGDAPWHEQALRLRCRSPGWGAGRIRLEFPAQDRPSERAIQRLLRRRALAPAPPGRRPALAPRGVIPHEVWQMDAVEQERIGTGQMISWLRIADEASGAVLKTTAFDEGHFNQVPLAEVQATIRQAFKAWGLPQAIKVDNGSPWGSCGDLPTPLALWLIGLGVGVRWSPPRRPQANGVVERSHGTAQRWVGLSGCPSVAELQARLDREDFVQREQYPALEKLTRREAYPGLEHSGRPYSEANEGRLWSWERVSEHLEGYQVARRVDGSGKVGLYGGKLYVGPRLKGREVVLSLDGRVNEWLVADDKGTQLCRRPLSQFDEASLRDLSLLQRPRK